VIALDQPVPALIFSRESRAVLFDGRLMQQRWRKTAAIVFLIATGIAGAETYARLAAPFYEAIAKVIANPFPWDILSIEVAPDVNGHGKVLRLTGEVRRQPDLPTPSVRVITRISIGEVIEIPLVFWSVLLIWPAASLIRRLGYFAAGAPVFAILVTATTVSQLLHSMAQASAILAGESNPVTVWERWSRFLESGGSFALEVTAAICSVAVANAAGDSIALRRQFGTARGR
jgi:hypothetical protein